MITRWWILTLVVVLAGAGIIGIANHQANGANFSLDVATGTVMGKSQQILVDPKGMSLYYLTSDTADASACTGTCAGNWPPLLSDSAPTAPSSAAGKLAIVKTANGSQVSYNGHLLYTFKKDTKPSDVTGEGLQGPKSGVWHVATPDVKPAT